MKEEQQQLKVDLGWLLDSIVGGTCVFEPRIAAKVIATLAPYSEAPERAHGQFCQRLYDCGMRDSRYALALLLEVDPDLASIAGGHDAHSNALARMEEYDRELQNSLKWTAEVPEPPLSAPADNSAGGSISKKTLRFDGESVRVHPNVTTEADLERALHDIDVDSAGGDMCLGLDCEWTPGSASGTALVQVAFADRVLLLDGERQGELAVKLLRTLGGGGRRTVVVAAVGKADFKRLGLPQACSSHCNVNLVDLQEQGANAIVEEQVGASAMQTPGLSLLAAKVCAGLAPDKSVWQRAPWGELARPLPQEALEYAALDAYAALAVFQARGSAEKIQEMVKRWCKSSSSSSVVFVYHGDTPCAISRLETLDGDCLVQDTPWATRASSSRQCKTLCLRQYNSKELALVSLPLDEQLPKDWRPEGDCFQGQKSQSTGSWSLVCPVEVPARFGMPVGGVGPFVVLPEARVRTRVALLLGGGDAADEWVRVGAGSPGKDLLIRAEALRRMMADWRGASAS